MFSLAQFIEWLENQGATRGEVEGGRAPRALVKGAWKVSNTTLSREAIETALVGELSAAQKRELGSSEGRFWFRVERPLGAWMVCVQWQKSLSSRPVRRVNFVSQAAAMSDPIEAAETAGLTSQSAMQGLKGAAPSLPGLADKPGAAPRNLEQMREAARQLPVTPPPLTTQSQNLFASAPWENDTPRSAPPPLPRDVDYSFPSAPKAPTAAWEEVSPDTYRWIFGIFVTVVLLFSVRGCNAWRDFSPMLAEQIREDANKDSSWIAHGIRLEKVDLHEVDSDSYEGTGTYSDGDAAKVEVEVKTRNWVSTPQTWSYNISPQ